MNYTYDGKINLIVGPMWSGKTSELIRRYKRYSISGCKCLMVKYKGDTRYDDVNVITHDGIEIVGTICQLLCEIDYLICDYDVICIDEIQFYKDGDVMCDKWANQGKIVEACGLNSTFNRTPFPIMSALYALAEDITHIKAVSKKKSHIACEDAPFSLLIKKQDPGDQSIEIIGGDELYEAVTRKEYFKHNQSNTYESFCKVLKIYNDANNVNISIGKDILEDELTKSDVFTDIINKFR